MAPHCVAGEQAPSTHGPIEARGLLSGTRHTVPPHRPHHRLELEPTPRLIFSSCPLMPVGPVSAPAARAVTPPRPLAGSRARKRRCRAPARSCRGPASSRNGTLVNSVALARGGTADLTEGDAVAFGDASLRFILTDGSAPSALARRSGSGEIHRWRDGMVVLPSEDEPAACMREREDGT